MGHDVKIFESVKQLPKTKSVITIGNFDGVHLGHRAIVRTLVQEAQTRGVRSVVMTFDPHPMQVLFPEKKLLRIFSREDQIEELKKLNVENLLIEPFTKELSRVEAPYFLENWIYQPFSPQLLIVGYDFSFGARRSGSIPEILAFARDHGFEVMVIPPQKIVGEAVSSSRIRKAILEGNIELANILLDRKFYIEGEVQKGDARGSKLGFATANLNSHAELMPSFGVYVTRTLVGSEVFDSVTNVGRNPTFQTHEKLKIETHIFDFNKNIYGSQMRVEFLKRLRNEKKFDSVEDLKIQIKKDILETKAYFATLDTLKNG